MFSTPEILVSYVIFDALSFKNGLKLGQDGANYQTGNINFARPIMTSYIPQMRKKISQLSRVWSITPGVKIWSLNSNYLNRPIFHVQYAIHGRWRSKCMFVFIIFSVLSCCQGCLCYPMMAYLSNKRAKVRTNAEPRINL